MIRNQPWPCKYEGIVEGIIDGLLQALAILWIMLGACQSKAMEARQTARTYASQIVKRLTTTMAVVALQSFNLSTFLTRPVSRRLDSCRRPIEGVAPIVLRENNREAKHVQTWPGYDRRLALNSYRPLHPKEKKYSPSDSTLFSVFRRIF